MNSARALVRLQTSFWVLDSCATYPLCWTAPLRGSSSESLTEVLHHWDVIMCDGRLAHTDDWADRYKVFWQQASAKLYDDIVRAGSWGHLAESGSLYEGRSWTPWHCWEFRKRGMSLNCEFDETRAPLVTQENLSSRKRLSYKEECCIWESCCISVALTYVEAVKKLMSYFMLG